MSFFDEVKGYECIDELSVSKPCNDDGDIVLVKEHIKAWVIKRIKELRDGKIPGCVVKHKHNCVFEVNLTAKEQIVDFLMREFNITKEDLK